jgi:hypothetical protein
MDRLALALASEAAMPSAPDALIRSVPPVHHEVALLGRGPRRDVRRVDGHAFVREDVDDAVRIGIRMDPESVDDGRVREIGGRGLRVHLDHRPEGAGVRHFGGRDGCGGHGRSGGGRTGTPRGHDHCN